jgi:hypothetical protein
VSDPVIIAIITAAALAIGSLLTFLGSRANSRSAIDKRIDERVSAELSTAWARIDALEVKQTTHAHQMGAVGRVLRAIAGQWPNEHPPNLNPADIALIEDAIPAHWIRSQKETS